MTWNSALHPRAAKGAAGGGQFAKGSAPAPSKKPAGNGSRYTGKQFGQLQSLQKQHAAGKKLTAKQAHALHAAHALHEQHLAAVAAAARPKATVKPIVSRAAAGKATARKPPAFTPAKGGGRAFI